jgi:hypothetical protein
VRLAGGLGFAGILGSAVLAAHAEHARPGRPDNIVGDYGGLGHGGGGCRDRRDPCRGIVGGHRGQCSGDHMDIHVRGQGSDLCLRRGAGVCLRRFRDRGGIATGGRRLGGFGLTLHRGCIGVLDRGIVVPGFMGRGVVIPVRRTVVAMRVVRTMIAIIRPGGVARRVVAGVGLGGRRLIDRTVDGGAQLFGERNAAGVVARREEGLHQGEFLVGRQNVHFGLARLWVAVRPRGASGGPTVPRA